jgi:hypothetical protein
MASVISGNATFSVVDPAADKIGAIATPLTARLETLNGKVPGLLSNSKPRPGCTLPASDTTTTLRLAVGVQEIRFKQESVVYGTHELPVTR